MQREGESEFAPSWSESRRTRVRLGSESVRVGPRSHAPGRSDSDPSLGLKSESKSVSDSAESECAWPSHGRRSEPSKSSRSTPSGMDGLREGKGERTWGKLVFVGGIDTCVRVPHPPRSRTASLYQYMRAVRRALSSSTRRDHLYRVLGIKHDALPPEGTRQIEPRI